MYKTPFRSGPGKSQLTAMTTVDQIWVCRPHDSEDESVQLQLLLKEVTGPTGDERNTTRLSQ